MGKRENWKEYRHSFEKEAEKRIKTLSIEEKVALMSGNRTKEDVLDAIHGKGKTHYNEKPYLAGGISEKGIPSLAFVDGSRGVVCGRGEATCFPAAVMRGASFDTKLEESVGSAIADEIVAEGGNLFGGVCVNIPYHPGWGRAQETYGEDTCLVGEMGAAMVQGIQSKGVIACIKHFAFNSMENSRFKVNILCDKRTEREVFLPQFKKCIDAGAGAVMSAYNSYAGKMCGQNEYLLKQVLKKEWGFDGFIISDFNWGIRDTASAANAGLDIEMPNTCFYGENLLQAVRDGLVAPEVIEEAALRIVRTLLAHQKKLEKVKKIKRKPGHYSKLALKCAEEGLTLIRNQDGILPFTHLKAGKKIVVLGKLADMDCTGDVGSSRVFPPYTVTPLQGIRAAASEAEVIYYSGESLSHCKRLSEEADAVIIVTGNNFYEEGEYVSIDSSIDDHRHTGGDRPNGLGLKDREKDIIMTVSSVRKDAVVVLVGGSMISMTEWHDKVGAILLAYYPGMEGGTAIGEVLFGKINPTGKLPFTITEKEEDLPEITWDTEEQVYGYYHGYTLLDKKNRHPLYPFGFGLSYTVFQIKNEKVWFCNGQLCVSVEIQNIGKWDGAEVVQVYIGMPESKAERPVRALKAFRKVFLKKGEKKTEALSVPMEDLMYYDEKEERFVLEQGEYEVYVGTSSALEDLVKIR